MSAAPPPPPPGLNIHATRQPEIYSSAIITIVLAILAVAARFWCRRMTKSAIKLDDWLIVVALCFGLGFFVSTMVWVRQGYGLHLWVLTPAFVNHFFKNLFVGEILYTLTLVFAKFAILAFYRRIFVSTITIPVYVLASIVFAWGISVIFVVIFQCKPVSGFWNRQSPADCAVDDYAFFIGNAVPNIVTDAAILVLPIPFIFRLHRSTSQKFALAGVFMLGGFIVIISMVRLIILVQIDATSPDLDWNFAFLGVWTSVETQMAIVCACLPSLRPILSLIMTGSPNQNHYLKNQSDKGSNPGLFSKKSKGLGSYGSQGDEVDEADSQRGFVPSADGLPSSRKFQAKAYPAPVRKGGADSLDSDLEMQKPQTIYVRKDMDVDYSNGR